MTKLYYLLQDLFSTPRYPPRYDLAACHAIISGDSIYMAYWVKDTQYRARCASAAK